ncbi:MLO-like protein [Vigna angularis]|uniref:MLO-like protein n=1 Tax=Phaseolus angularis TaxID=3914 RepID=A0A8T0JE00_PHAAN|nr:MLO-like protein [Vigna angularis]
MEGRSLENTPTWAVAVVCFVLLSVSIIIEYILNIIGKWLKKKHKRALHESLEKIKSELMLLGFISLLLTVGQSVISRICISEKVAGTFHPCTHQSDHKTDARILLSELFGSDHDQNPRRILAAGGSDKCAAQGKVPFVSSEGIHQLHIFIFVLAVFHVLYCILTLALGRAKICFFRQFVRSVPKVDYLTLRHGFMMSSNLVHHRAFSPVSHPWLVLLSVAAICSFDLGTKLQVIITKMGQRIQERGEVVKGVPLVQPGDDLFWFNKPRLILYLVNFVLFQLQFGMKSCFHSQTEDVVIKISMGYVTLPLYALVTQMGSTMKPTIFNERVAMALRNWHHAAKKHVKQQNRRSQSQTPLSGPTTPDHSVSQAHLLRRWHSEMDTYPTDFEAHRPCEIDLGPSTKVHHQEMEMDHGPPQNVNDQTQHEINIEHGKEFSFDNR